MASLLRIGVIGSGFGQRVHIPAFRANPHCRVTAIGASTLEKARAVAMQHRISKAYGDWKALVQDPEIDAVSIAVPPRLQPAIALAALKQGKPVFCEKPVAVTTHECQALILLARQRRIPAMVNFEFPDIDVWKKAKNLLDHKKLGRLRHVQVSWQVEIRAFQTYANSWKTNLKAGGGVLNGFVSHTFYYLEYLLGPIQKLSANVSTDCLIQLGLQFRNRLAGCVTVSNNAYKGSGHRLELYGDKGSLKLVNEGSDYTKGFKLRWDNRVPQTSTTITSTHARDRADGRIATTALLVDRFVAWIRTGKPARPNLFDGNRVQRLMDYVRQSHQQQKWIHSL